MRKRSDRYNNLGYPEKDQPYYGAESHMDGLCTIGVPQEVVHGTPEEIYKRYISSGPKGDIGRSPEVMGHNSVPLFEDPEMTLGMGSFTTFAFVCLNDQTRKAAARRRCCAVPTTPRRGSFNGSARRTAASGRKVRAGRASTTTRRTIAATCICRKPSASSFLMRPRSRRRMGSAGPAQRKS